MTGTHVVGGDVNFTTLTLSDVSAGLEAAGREVHVSPSAAWTYVS